MLLHRYTDSSQLDEDIFGSSEALLPALVNVPNLAATDCTVLITGEAGTGTELVAKAIHRLSYRSPRSLVRVNCAEIPLQLIASEQFGRHKGSWSQAAQPRSDHFQMANGGTILLEGVGDLSTEAQLTLLRFLQETESHPPDCNDSIRPDVRLIATNPRDLHVAVADGSFRRALFDRLNGFQIKIPALRERKGEIPILARYFVNRYARRAGKTSLNLNSSIIDLLQSYPWPGNMRELQTVMERLVAHCAVENIMLAPKCIHEAALIEMLAGLPGWESNASAEASAL